MSKSTLLRLLPLLLLLSLLAGCGWNTEQALGDHRKIVNYQAAANVVWGRVVTDLPGAVVESVTIDAPVPRVTYNIGSDGSFAIANVSGGSRVIAELVAGGSRRQLNSFCSAPTSVATIVTTSQNSWNGETSLTVTVDGLGTPINVTPLTDIVYRPVNSATREAVNAFLNERFATNGLDYVADPQPAPEVSAAASGQFPR